MISRLLIHPNKDVQMSKATELLGDFGLTNPHPDLLWINTEEENSGVEMARRIIEHFKLKPYSAKGRVVVVVGAEELTTDAQNALLKTLEEPPPYGQLVLTASSENSLLPTILSRCHVTYLENLEKTDLSAFNEVIEQIQKANLEERFNIIEKTDDKDRLLLALLHHYQEELHNNPKVVESAKVLLEAEEWEKSNVNVRGILE